MISQLDTGKIKAGVFGNVEAIGNDGKIDLNISNCFTLTPSANITLAIQNAQDCSKFTLVVTNGNAHQITFPTSVVWENGEAPVLATSGVDVLDFISSDGGSHWYGIKSMLNENKNIIFRVHS